MAHFRKFLLFTLVTILATACGGGDDGGGSSGIVGSWKSPCTGVGSGSLGEPTHFVEITMTFNADSSMFYAENFFEDLSCTTALTNGVFAREYLGGYMLGEEVTALDELPATEIDVMYQVVMENGDTEGAAFEGFASTVVRITSNQLTTGIIDPVDGSEIQDLDIDSAYGYTRQ